MSDARKAKGWGNITAGYYAQKKVIEFVYKICRALLLFGLCFLIVQPLLNKISVSFMASRDLHDTTVISIPRNFTLGNYITAIDLMSYFPSLLQTVLIVLVSAVLQIASCTLSGYGFARFKFPLKNFWFFCVMLTVIIPPQTIMSSLYLNFRFFDVFGIMRLLTGQTVNLLNSYWGFFLLSATGMGLKCGLYTYMLRQYFRGIPKELEEAAWIDGCGRLKTFIRIMLPDAAPMLTSCFLFSFVWQWTDSFYTTLFLSRQRTLSGSLNGLAAKFGDWYAEFVMGSNPNLARSAPLDEMQQMVATGMLLFVLPLILLYLVAQKAFVESLSQTGIKM